VVVARAAAATRAEVREEAAKEVEAPAAVERVTEAWVVGARAVVARVVEVRVVEPAAAASAAVGTEAEMKAAGSGNCSSCARLVALE